MLFGGGDTLGTAAAAFNSNELPQVLQNFALAGNSNPHFLQVTTGADSVNFPQVPQKFAPSGN